MAKRSNAKDESKNQPQTEAPRSSAATLLDRIAAARRVSVPLIGVRTADQNATQAAICKRQDEARHPLVRYDAVLGLTGINEAGTDAVTKAAQDASVSLASTAAFVEAMVVAKFLPKLTVLFVHNAHRQLQSVEPAATASAVQALANLRDEFKKNFRMVVLLAPMFSLPPEIEPDIVLLHEALPTPPELRAMLVELVKTAGLAALDEQVLTKAVDALSGLSHFLAEQVAAMSLTENGIDVDELWERKRSVIEQTPGLSVYRGSQSFEDLRGLESVKARLSQHVDARTPVGVVVWIDEGADVFQNVDNDASGNKTDQQRALLVEMQKNNWRGVILVGVPGSGKSALASAFGREAGVPTIEVDFGAMESKWQGESEAQLRHSMEVIKAVGQGNAFFVLTANSLRGIRPQFQRRFKRGIFYMDLPTKEERAAIWSLYRERYEIPAGEQQPDDEGWTGAEIRECCESAWDTGTTLMQAAKYIVPVSRSRGREIEEMRRDAHGRFIDASKGGEYRYTKAPMETALRAIDMTQVETKGTA